MQSPAETKPSPPNEPQIQALARRALTPGPLEPFTQLSKPNLNYPMIPTPFNLRRLGVALIALSAASFAYGNEVTTVTLLDETFPAGQRTVEALPGTAAWYGSTATTIEQPAAGSIVARQVGANMHVFTHFAPSGGREALLRETLAPMLEQHLAALRPGSAARSRRAGKAAPSAR